MYCPHCATPLDASQRFCPTCGKESPVPTQPPPPPLPVQPGYAPSAVAPAPRPDSIRQGVGLVGASIAVGVVSMVVSLASVGSRAMSVIPNFLLGLVLTILWIVFLIMAYQGKSWARVGMAVLMVFSLTLVFSTFMFLQRGFPMTGLALPWIAFLLRVAGVYLLFTPQSSAWYRSMPS